MKKIALIFLLCSSIAFVACSNDSKNDSNISNQVPATVQDSEASNNDEGSQQDLEGQSSELQENDEVQNVEKTANGLLEAFKSAGLDIIDEVEYDAATDPNGSLGRPGEYIAKVSFNDSNFFNSGDAPELTIEVFENNGDMEKRKDYIATVTEDLPSSLKYYMYGKDVILFRIPYAVTPDKAAEYEAVFNEYMN